MRAAKIRRIARTRHGEKLLRDPGSRFVLRDYIQDRLYFPPGEAMFKRMEVGQVVVIDTFSFPVVGKVVEFDDQGVTVKDGVRILFDGEHGKFSQGTSHIPSNACIEKTYPIYTIPADVILGWGLYPGGKIPGPQ